MLDPKPAFIGSLVMAGIGLLGGFVCFVLLQLRYRKMFLESTNAYKGLHRKMRARAKEVKRKAADGEESQ